MSFRRFFLLLSSLSLPLTAALINPSSISTARTGDDLFNGLQILDSRSGKVAITISPLSSPPAPDTVRLDISLPGWGSGVHPTTFLCLQYLSDLAGSSIQSPRRVTDYGSGSGVLSVAAARLFGPSTKVTSVDIEAEALEATRANWELNFPSGTDEGCDLETYHTREVIPSWPISDQDLVLANILIGALVRPSMIAVLVNALKAPDAEGEGGGIICFSGILPNERESLMRAYEKYLCFDDDASYGELSGTDKVGSTDSTFNDINGFDVRSWCRVVGRRSCGSDFVGDMSEMAVS